MESTNRRYIDHLRRNNDLWERYCCSHEYVPWIKDKYKRFPFLLNNHNQFIPSVSSYLYENNLIRPNWPNDKEFAVSLTHDVDLIYPRGLSSLYYSKESIKSGHFINGLHHLINFRGLSSKRNPWYNLKKIASLEKEFDATSSFYLMAMENYEKDANYSYWDLENVAQDLILDDFEIGLHSSFQAFQDLNRFRIEKERIEKITHQKIQGHRAHYLCFETPFSWENYVQLGFSYDTTFGYAECPGFRNGMCYPFYPFNNINDYEFPIIEVPLTVMDTTLFGYLQLDVYNSWKLIKRLIDEVKKYSGNFTLLWHNNNFSDKNYLKLYRKILEYCMKQNGWMASANKIVDWWKKEVIK